MILLLDNYDSFTYNLVDYFHQLQTEVVVFRNDEPIEDIIALDYTGVVLSPGPGTPQKSGHLNQLIIYFKSRLPILGICLGHQALGTLFGARLVHASIPKHGKISRINILDDYIFKNIPTQFNVVRYHSLLLEGLPEQLECIAYTDEDENMALKHRTLNIRGLQFHPEAYLSEYGLQILNNWITFNQIH